MEYPNHTLPLHFVYLYHRPYMIHDTLNCQQLRVESLHFLPKTRHITLTSVLLSHPPPVSGVPETLSKLHQSLHT